MKIGVLTVLLQQLPLEGALDYVREAGLDTVELGTGNFSSAAHCNPDELLADAGRLRAFQQAFESRGMSISALSCHGNPLHPDKAIAHACTEVQHKTIQLAERLGVQCVNLFSGCPGSSEEDTHANWVTCPWPPEFSEVLAWQWNEKIIPFWREEAAYAKAHGDTKLCFEMHPGMAIYNPETLLRLRDVAGDSIGCNFDPSHLFWQGIDPVAAIRLLGDAIYHVHAKDSRVDPYTVNRVGVLDTKPYADEAHRAWIFRTVGYGHSLEFWKALASELRLIGYDDVLSIEHEDSLFSGPEGMAKAADLLLQVIPKEPRSKMWWD